MSEPVKRLTPARERTIRKFVDARKCLYESHCLDLLRELDAVRAERDLARARFSMAREEGAVTELLCVLGFAEAVFPGNRAVKTLVADLRRGEHTKALSELSAEHINASDDVPTSGRKGGARE